MHAMAPVMKNPRLLVVEDDRHIAEIVATVARETGYEVAVTSDGQLARALREDTPDVIVLDLLMPEKDGFETMQYLSQHCRHARVIILSGQGEPIRLMAERMAGALRLSVVENIGKPFRIAELRARLLAVRSAMDMGEVPYAGGKA